MHQRVKSFFMQATALLLLGTAFNVQATDKGLFWKMESPTGQVSYLFGTMHTDDNRVTDFSASVLDVIKQVDLFVMEIQPNSGVAHYDMQEGSLKNLLTEDEMDQFRQLVDFHVMHMDKALKMKPWLLAFVFSQSKPQTPYAQDNLLMRSAEDFGKPVQGLETAQEHFGTIDSFSLDEQLVMLRSALKLKQEEKERDFEKLMKVYLSEDSDQLLHLDAEITSTTLPKALWQKMRVKLLDERNDLMVKRALDLANRQSIFIAVGAAHLAGENGFIQAFKQAGYQLTRIKK